MNRIFQQWPEAVGGVDGFLHEDIPPPELIILTWYYPALHDIVSDGPHVLLSYKMVPPVGILIMEWFSSSIYSNFFLLQFYSNIYSSIF